MSRRSRLLRALARYCARVHAAKARDGWHPLGPLDRWREARWWLSAHAAGGALYPTRRVRRWQRTWRIVRGRRVAG